MKKFIVAIAALVLAACTSPKDNLADKTFKIVELNGTEYVSMGEQPAYITFQDGKISASVGGNSIFANYEEGKDGAITLTEGGMTKMMVPEEYREDEFVEALNSVVSFAICECCQDLSLLNAEGTVVIKAVPQEQE